MSRVLGNFKCLRLFLLFSLLTNSILLFRLFQFHSSCPQQDCPTIKNHLHYPQAQVPSPNHLVAATNATVAERLKATSIISSMESRQIIFVGGVPRSGTTLVRAMLDAHPDIRCGEETRVIPRVLAMRSRWNRSEKEHRRLLEAGIKDAILDRAMRAFITEIILGHGSPAEYLCNKDPLVLNYMNDVLRIYPKSKFILLIRDGRAVAYSIVSRNVTISGVNSKNYLSAAMFWNKMMTRMSRDCSILGRGRCLEVYYEKLVKNPKEWMQRILKFVNVPWHDNVLRHHELINKEVSLSRWDET